MASDQAKQKETNKPDPREAQRAPEQPGLYWAVGPQQPQRARGFAQ